MPIRRREALYLLACASGWPVVKGSSVSAETTDKHLTGESILDDSQAPSHSETATGESVPVERVLGIGGLFFRAHDSKALAAWYRTHLGVGLTPSGTETASWHTEAG